MQGSAELLEALAHAENADAYGRGLVRFNMAGQPAALVDDLQLDIAVAGETNLRARTTGMTHNIGEAFLRDAE